MVGIGPDDTGWFHPEAIKELEAVGDWILVNGEGIFETRPWTSWKENETVRFVKTKDEKYIYMHVMEWPGPTICSHLVKPKPESEIFMLGITEPLPWKITEGILEISIPQSIQTKKPCKYAWTFKIEQ